MTLRIAHLTPTYFSANSVVGGGERYVDYISRALKTYAGEEIYQKIVTVDAKAAALFTNGIEMRVLRNISRKPGMMNHIPEGLRTVLQDVDVIHIHQSLTGFGAYCTALAAEIKKPFVTTDLGGGSHASMLTSGLQLSSGVISISKFAQRLIGAHYRGPHIAIVGPVDTDKFVSRDVYKDESYQFLCVSRLLPHKGIDNVIQALPNGAGLRIVGSKYDNVYFNYLEQLSKDKRVEFIFNASDEDLVNYYNQASVFIQASVTEDCYGNKVPKSELMGLTTLEALSCNIPVIVSSTGSLPELIDRTDVGKTYNTVSELSCILREFNSDKRLHNNVREYALKNFSFPVVGKKVFDFYRSTAGL